MQRCNTKLSQAPRPFACQPAYSCIGLTPHSNLSQAPPLIRMSTCVLMHRSDPSLQSVTSTPAHSHVNLLTRAPRRHTHSCRYFYDGRWRVASAKLPAADGRLPRPVAGTPADWTLAHLFWDTFFRKGYRLPANTNRCYMFELTSPSTVVVVRYVATPPFVNSDVIVNNALCLGRSHR
jgi:hypothetical protein